MEVSCWAYIVVSHDDVAVAVAAAFEVVAVLLLLPTNSQPANRPTPKIRASTSARSTIAPERPGRFCGGGCGGALRPRGTLVGWPQPSPYRVCGSSRSDNKPLAPRALYFNEVGYYAP